jgi:thiamine pyrophosphate-dependent acetolactate synthase large subunit-like protein
MIDRGKASKYLVGRLRDEVVITSLGNEKYDLRSAGERDRNFYNWNAMGMASSLGLGLAMARPELKVIVYDGDGSLLMNLGALATIAMREAKNLIHIVWDNRSYAMTGGQPTATAFHTDLAAMAKAAGYPKVERVETLAAFRSAADRALTGPGPWFIHCLTEEKPVEGGGLPSPTSIKQRFMDAIGARH